MVLRPSRRAIIDRGLRSLPAALLGAVATYGASQSRNLVVGVAGFVALGFVIFSLLGLFWIQVRLADGILSSQSLFERHQVRVSEISRIVPVDMTLARRGLFSWRSSVRFFDVRTTGGSTGIWLNPTVYGHDGVQVMLDKLNIQPDAAEETRSLDV